jgi:hypothetical protein
VSIAQPIARPITSAIARSITSPRGGGAAPAPPDTDNLLLESGDALLLESGDLILLESA